MLPNCALCNKADPFTQYVRGHRPRLQICDGLTVGAVYDRAHFRGHNDSVGNRQARAILSWPILHGKLSDVHQRLTAPQANGRNSSG